MSEPLLRAVDDGDRSKAEFKVGDVVFDTNVNKVGTITNVRSMTHGRFIYDHTGLGPGTPNLAFSDHLAETGTVRVTDERDA